MKQVPVLALLISAVLLTVALGTINPGGDPGAIRARNATGGPVKPATTRDYFFVGLILAAGVICMFVGLFLWKR